MEKARSDFPCLSVVEDGVCITFHPHAHAEGIVLVKAIRLSGLLRGQIPHVLVTEKHVTSEDAGTISLQFQHCGKKFLSMMRHYLLYSETQI